MSWPNRESVTTRVWFRKNSLLGKRIARTAATAGYIQSSASCV
ncbi:hypothetical protein Bhyg_04466, partial [Pseudolycoriella hygida]